MSTATEWAQSPEHPGYLTKTIKRGPVTIEILRPELDPAERSRRERQIKPVLEGALSTYYYRKERTS